MFGGYEEKFVVSMLEDIWVARQPSTVRRYCYALRKLFSFCYLFFDKVELPISAIRLAKYLVFQKESGASKSGITTIFVALKWAHGFFPGVTRFNCPLEQKFLAKLKDSAVRNIIARANRKEPITGRIIGRLFEGLSDDATVEELRDVLMPAIAYSLLLRFDELSHLNCLYMSNTERGIKFLIPSSKTDVFREGKNVFLARDEGSLSVAKLLLSYMGKAGLKFGSNQFLFSKVSRGRMLNEKVAYSSYLKLVKDKMAALGFEPEFYGTHSMRSGGATDLAPKVTEFELRLSGRWKDPRSIQAYVKVSDERRFNISESLFLN